MMVIPLRSSPGRGHSVFHSLLSTLFLLFLTSPISAAASYDPYTTAARCPPPCDDSAVSSSSWALYSDIQQLTNCNETVLLDLNLNHVAGAAVPIRACTVQASSSSAAAAARLLKKRQFFSYSSSSANGVNGTNGRNGTTGSASTDYDGKTRTHDLDIFRKSTPGIGDEASFSDAVLVLAHAVQAQTSGGPSIFFAKAHSIVAGVYAGPQIEARGLTTILQHFTDREASGASQHGQIAAQRCGLGLLGSEILGIFVDTTGSLISVTNALAGWNNGTCLDHSSRGDSSSDTWTGVSIATVPGKAIAVGPTDGGAPGQKDSTNGAKLRKRATCKYTQAVANDGCQSVATRCGITQAQLVSFNGDPNLCNGIDLQVGQYLCCSAGTLPDFTPQPNADGTCKTYTAKAGDYCSSIAQANTMTVSDIEARNLKTWGWAGCGALIPGQIFCLSTGSPPMPGAVVNAICGPTVPGTPRPADMSTLVNLNPCPLSVCCNVWGQCGITADFCVANPADTGAPGTAKPGTNGCVASCGMSITNNAAPPAAFKAIGYWEAWNSQRPCLHMKASQIDTTRYTHVHFAFATITDTFGVSVGNLTDAFADFKALTGVKRILSFGGWSFSTDYDTFPIFRTGVTAAQRQTLTNNIAAFVSANGLDGVDFDWEYPGATDIPGIPPGSPQDGTNYLAFLKLMRAALPTTKSVAIAAPASYWYLRGFPISDIAAVVDYIVYMTYDLHGQWDYGNAYSDDGCAGGNCLRSHINKTETLSALAMITHAGVQASKVVVGMALYGRSFQMTTPGCYSPDCTYTGPLSGARPGRCTGTAGYISNFEIRELMATDNSVQQYTSDEGDMLVYGGNQWISWMTTDTYNSRVAWVKGLNFGGTSDWAADLDADYDDGAGPGQGDAGAQVVYVSPDIYTEPNPVIQCYPPCTLVLPPMVLSTKTTITMPPVTATYSDTWSTVITLGGTVMTTSAVQIRTTVITLPPITTQTISLSNVIWNPTPVTGPGNTSPGNSGTTTSGAAGAVIWFTSSIIPPPVLVTQTQTRSVAPPIVWTYSPGPYPTPAYDGVTWPPPPPPPAPPPGFPSAVTVKGGPPSPTCRPGQICGLPCLLNCGSPGCLFICGCIGPFCSSGSSGCVGAGCTDPGDDNSGGGSNNGNDGTCRQKQTVSYCAVTCTDMSFPGTTTTKCDTPTCTRTITSCGATGSTTTTTQTLSCPAMLPYSYDYDLSGPIATGEVADGTMVYAGDFDYPPVTNIVTVTVSPTVVVVTSTAVVEAYIMADCTIWDDLFFFEFEVLNIQNWATDGGAALHKQLNGCGALTGWRWFDPTSTNFAKVYFNLPFFIKDGCVERAIVSAGGPKIQCKSGDSLFGDRRRQPLVRPRAQTTELPSRLVISDPPTYTYPTTATTTTGTPTYVPMSWDANSTVVLTWTETDDVYSTYTTTQSGYTFVPSSTTTTSSASPTMTVLPISKDGKCGATNGNTTCAGSAFGQCCGSAGTCGSTPAFCAGRLGCQVGFGNCTPVSTSGKCGSASSNNEMCLYSTFGDCCAANGTCGKTTAFCNTDEGCQVNFGTCVNRISTDGKCGAASATDATCAGSTFGQCCGPAGTCGSTPAFCAGRLGCQVKYGNCTPVSTSGKCSSASTNNEMCLYSAFGDCCAANGTCGSSTAFCNTDEGCQPGFGTCVNRISTDGKCGAASSTDATCAGSTFGSCCGPAGTCGSTPAFCAGRLGCQTKYGNCTPVSTDGKCGAASSNNEMCLYSAFGDCCSSKGTCGNSASGACSLASGCQPNFGTCTT